jgi:xanthine dehydrogenase large subunit
MTLEILNPPLSPPHDSARLHVAGESLYVDDRPFMHNELHVGLFYSPHAKAKILSIDTSLAEASPGVACVLTAVDLHHNLWGSIICEQPFLAHTEVNFVGEIIAVVGAKTAAQLAAALKLIKVEYRLGDPVLSIDQAIKIKQFIAAPKVIARGQAKDFLRKAPHRLKGHLVIKGADHFYLENQAAIAYPQEDGHMEIHSSTQHPTETQSLVAEALGLPLSSVVCITERLGGGFGGKETQAAPFAVYAAMVAQKTRAPARLVLNKDDDMIITGKRNPYQVAYEVGFDNDGKIMALLAKFHGDGGAYADLSTSILERALAHADNAYFIPHLKLEGQVCRTNFHPHTAFRGFGGPKGVAMIEHVMEEIGHHLKIDALDIRKLNCYQGANNITPYGQEIKNNLLPELFSLLEERAEYRKRRLALESWNQNPENNPRGLSMTAVKFGISFTTRFLNQGHALVHIFRDGSIQVATGGVEMGQGIQARIKSLVAELFGVEETRVRVMPTRTDKSANTSPTAASSGTDLNGTAAVIAAQKIKSRLASIFRQLMALDPALWPEHTAALASTPELVVDDRDDPEIIFSEGQVYAAADPSRRVDFGALVNATYLSRVALSEYGFYKVPGLSFNKITGQGDAFLYFTQGVAASEVEIDRWTGEIKVLRTDILMDAGTPINDALDRGQIAGGFIQGLGWMTSESLYYNEAGALLSHSPSTYKIPSIHDIPRIFKIELVKNPHNTVNIRGTKAVGEPPLMLCFSVWNALKNALAYKTKELPHLPIPANEEVILRALKPEAFLEQGK